MILLFGGTTEGKICAELLDMIDQPYIYSTKTKVKHTKSKATIYGALDFDAMQSFCINNNVKLVIDAAHPFAAILHKTINDVTNKLKIKTIRFERDFPDLNKLKGIRCFSSFEKLIEELEYNNIRKNILALTGVQTINKFENARSIHTCYFRILNTDLSLQKGLSTGINPKYLIQAKAQINKDDLLKMINRTNANLLITKESGTSGFFNQKYELSQELNIPLWIILRPSLGEYSYTVFSSKELLKLILKLRKDILKKEDNSLRSGFTTGSSACAAAVAALMSIITRDIYSYSEIKLPDGEIVKLPVFVEYIKENKAAYIVVKNGGDDPDVTHTHDIGCSVEISSQKGIRFHKGLGVGLVTLPGLQVAVGEAAINPTPRKMISDALSRIIAKHKLDIGIEVSPFVPQGERLAKLTFNPRIGVIGGISILGTTGRVMPYSSEAFINSIRQQVRVAHATKYNHVVATSGKRSEKILQKIFPELHELCFVHFGNFIGETIDVCNTLNIGAISIGIMTGKAAKLAEGHLDTHSKKVKFNPRFIANIALECGYPQDIVEKIKTFKLANAIADIIPFSMDEKFYTRILELCYQTCNAKVNKGINFRLILIGPDGSTIE